MYSIQDIVDKCAPQLREIKQQLETGVFHPELASILKNQKPSVAMELRESIRAIPLSEFLAKSGSSGIAGAAYTVPDKLHDDLILESGYSDIVPLISRVVSKWEGGDLKVNIASPEEYKAQRLSSGATAFTQTVSATQATLSPITVGIPIRVTEDMIEDEAYGIVDWHISQAAKAMCYETNDMALTVLQAASDGWGTLNSGTSGDADETKFTNGTTTDIITAIRSIAYDRWIPNTVVTTAESWGHSISVQAKPVGWDNLPAPQGFHAKIGILDVLLSDSPTLHASTDAVNAAFTNCISIIFDRNAAMLTGRKRWLELKEYSDPVKDIAGAVVTSRQDSVTLYDDSVYTLTET